MAIFSPTIYYFGQPVQAAAAGFIIRPDANASSVTVALPGTQFGSTFSQASFRSDISGFINGGSSFADAALTGSGQTTSATTNFSGVYATSMSRPSLSNMGAIPGTTTQVNFGTGAFTMEAWINPVSGTADSWVSFGYNTGWGFFGWSSAGYYRWVAQNSSAGEALRDYSVALTNGTWVHIFFSRSGTTWYGGVNGTIRANFTLSGATGTSVGTQFCGWAAAAMRPSVFQDFRITKGVARYTGAVGASYTVPQSIVTIG